LHEKPVSFFRDDGFACFGGISGFIFVFSVDGFGQDAEIFFLRILRKVCYVFLDPEVCQSGIDESVLGFPDEERDGGEKWITFFVGPCRVDGIENVGKAENGGDVEGGLAKPDSDLISSSSGRSWWLETSATKVSSSP
jgi:hypothetical protein